MKRLLLALSLIACASPEQTVRASDNRLTQPTFIAALAWDEALLQGPCPEVRLIPVGFHATADIVVVAGRDPKGRRGVHDESAGTILIDFVEVNRVGDEGDLPTVIAHELGHALGIPQEEHSANENDLMHNALPPGRPLTITGYDVAWVCEQW